MNRPMMDCRLLKSIFTECFVRWPDSKNFPIWSLVIVKISANIAFSGGSGGTFFNGNLALLSQQATGYVAERLL